MDTLLRRTLVLVLVLAALHWILDSVYLYTSLRAGEFVLPGDQGPTLWGTLLTEAPRYVLLGRVTFVLALAVGGMLVVAYLRRVWRRESGLLHQLEGAGDLFSRHGVDGRFLYASRGFADIFGADPSALRGGRAIPGWQVVNRPDLAAAFERLSVSDQPVVVTTRLRAEDGREVWLESVGRRVPAARAGDGPEVVVISRDATARRRTEEALAVSEQRLRLITESMQEILWLRIGDRIEYINSAFERIFGLPPEAPGRHGLRDWVPWVHAEDRDRVRLAIDQAVTRHEPLDEEFRIVRPDGQVRWLHARTVHVETGPDGRAVAVGVAADITSRRRAEDALRASAERYRNLYEAAHVGVTITSLDGSLIYANPAAAEVYGAATVRDLLQHTRRHGGIATFYRDAAERETFIAELQADPRGRASRVMQMQRLDGRPAQLRVSCGLVANPETGRNEIVAILEDVTERLRAEEELRRSEERYRRLVEFLPEGVVVHDGAHVVFANPAGARLFGATPEGIVGRGLGDLAAESDRGVFAPPSPGPVAGYAPPVVGEEVWLRRPDGSLFPAAVASLPLAGFAGGSILTVINDRSGLRRASDEIAAQQALLAALVETMPLGIVAKDLDHDLRYVVWNSYMEEELGLAREDVLGQTDLDVFPAGIAAELRRQDQLAATRGLPQDLGELALQLPDRRLELHVVKVPVRDADGRVARVFSLVENVTRQKQLQARLQQANRMEAVGRLAGAVAHDFNTLLQVVQGYTEVIQQGLEEGGPLQQEAAMVLQAVARARALVQRLVTYSRYDALQPEMVDVGALAERVAAEMRRAMPPDIALVVHRPDDLPDIYGDPHQLEQALQNLLANARDALPREGRIDVELAIKDIGRDFTVTRPWAKPGRYLQLTVRDNGCGIPEDARDHVYEPFYTTKGFGQGTGLGLATVYSVCKQHQGYVDFDSEMDVGSAFHVFLPIPGAGEYDPREAATAPAVARGRGELVMLVEDDDMIRSLTRQMLEHTGYRVLEARDGEDALEVFMPHADEVQLLVLDVVMPRMDGRQLYDNISELRPGVPVLFCSSYSADILESEYMLQVGAELLPKPFRAADLLAKVREVLDRGDGA